MKVFETQFQLWSLINKVSWTTLTISSWSLKKWKKWLAVSFNSNWYISTTWLLNSTKWSITTFFDTTRAVWTNKDNSWYVFLGQYWYIWIYVTTSTIWTFVSNWWFQITTYTYTSHWIYCVNLVWDWVSTKTYVNWLLVWTKAVGWPSALNWLSIWWANPIFTQSSHTWYIYSTILDDVDISQSEINKRYKQFLQLQPLLEKKTNFVYPKPTELKETWLVWAWNMKPNGNVLVDISGNGKNWTLTSCVPTKDWLKFPLSASKVAITNKTWLSWTQWTILVTFKPNATSTALFSFRDWSNNQIRFQSWFFSIFDSSTVEKRVAHTLYPWVWQTIALTWDNWTMKCYRDGVYTWISATWTWTWIFDWAQAWNLNLWYYAWFQWVEESDFRIYNRVLSDQEIKNYHNNFAKQIIFHDRFLYDKADWNIVRIDWAIHSWWNFKLVTETIWNTIINKWQKYLESISAGPVIFFPVPYSPWTLEFSMYATAWAVTQFLVLTTTTTWYTFEIRDDWSAQAIQIVKRIPWATIIYRTANNYIARNTLYWFKVTITNAWSITFFIKWWSFGNNYVQAVTPWSTWTNPIVDTAFNSFKFVWYSSSAVIWSRFWPITIKQWIQQ